MPWKSVVIETGKIVPPFKSRDRFVPWVLGFLYMIMLGIQTSFASHYVCLSVCLFVSPSYNFTVLMLFLFLYDVCYPVVAIYIFLSILLSIIQSKSFCPSSSLTFILLSYVYMFILGVPKKLSFDNFRDITSLVRAPWTLTMYAA